MTQQRITHIPVPGNSGLSPTGAMQFQGDWPGLFVRGDDAIGLMGAIEALARRLGDSSDPVVASALNQLQGIAEIIKHDVIVRKGP